MSYIHMEVLVKPEMLTSYIYGPMFGNAETVSFYLLHNFSTLNQCREVSCVTFVCKHKVSHLCVTFVCKHKVFTHKCDTGNLSALIQC